MGYQTVGVTTAVLNNKARKRLMVERQKAAMPAVAAYWLKASLLPSPIRSTPWRRIQRAQEGLPGERRRLYLAFLNAYWRARPWRRELSELLKLQGVLKLSFRSGHPGAQRRQAALLFTVHTEGKGDNESSGCCKSCLPGESVLEGRLAGGR